MGLAHSQSRPIASSSRQARSSRASGKRQAQPAWDLAYMYPNQGTWTEEEFLSLVTKRGYELCDGQVEMLPVPTELHQAIVLYLLRTLLAFIEPRQLGRAYFSGLRVRTRPGKIREPDIVFMLAKNDHKRTNKVWHGADLAMEIVSEDDPERDWKIKRREYASAGIAEYWIIDPAKGVITVLRLKGSSYQVHGEFKKGELATSALLKGFEVDVTASLTHDVRE